MFERYTEKARRVIFFARYEASQFGSPYIETEHMLLGLLRESKELTFRFLKGKPAEGIRQQIEATTVKRESIPTSVDLPLSNESKRVLGYAAEEAERLSHRHIGTEHLFLGLLREEKGFAAQILNERGVRLPAAREQLAEVSAAAAPSLAGQPSSDRNLVEQAVGGELHRFVGREKELESLERVLCRSTKNNAVLVGEPGVGKRAIVEGLAQAIADGNVPSLLAQKTIVTVDVSAAMRRQGDRGGLALGAGSNAIIFMEEFHSLLAAQPPEEPEAGMILKTALLAGKIQCISSATPEEYRVAREKHRWLDHCFRPIHVPPMSEAETVAVLLSVQGQLEKFHSRSFTDEAIRLAAHYACVYIKDQHLPESALDLMDEAAAHVNARPAKRPEEIVETMKRIKFISQRMENAIQNHEFEKARFYSDEEKKERANLSALCKKHNIGEPTIDQVTRGDVEEVLSRWTGIPVGTIRQSEPEAGRQDSPEE